MMIYTENIPDSFYSVLFVPLVRTYFSTLINTAFSGTVTPTTSISSFVPIVLSVSGGGIFLTCLFVAPFECIGGIDPTRPQRIVLLPNLWIVTDAIEMCHGPPGQLRNHEAVQREGFGICAQILVVKLVAL